VTPTIRPAVLRDADELARLRWDFRREHGTLAALTFDEFRQEFRAFAEDVLARKNVWRAWVAEVSGRLVGCVWLQFIEKVPHPSRRRHGRPLAYVTNMYVTPELRNSGLGRRLLDIAIGYADDRDVDGVVVWPSDRSVAFYERAGFGTEGAPLWRKVTGD
jgi:ribosomal protein S18 acetylase RimI-like enzyme